MENKQKRGRPKIDTRLIDGNVSSRRATVNWKYMYDGVDFIKENKELIPNWELLWLSDAEKQEAFTRNGVLEQIGRMIVQDNSTYDNCLFTTQCAASALKIGNTSRAVEKAIRTVRMALKKCRSTQGSPASVKEVNMAALKLETMAQKKLTYIPAINDWI